MNRFSPKKISLSMKFKRTKTGCLVCRKRKKKCDGGKPQCNYCQRLQLECKYEEAPKVWEIRRLSTEDGVVKCVTDVVPMGKSRVKRKIEEVVDEGDEADKTKESESEEKEKQKHEIMESKDENHQSQDQNHHSHDQNETSVTPTPPAKRDITPDYLVNMFNKSPDFFNFDLNSENVISELKHQDELDALQAAQVMETEDNSDHEPLEDSLDNQLIHDPINFLTNSEIKVTFTCNIWQSLMGYKFVLPKYISAESAEILISYFCEKMAPLFSVIQKTSSSLVCTYLPLAAADSIVLNALLAWVALHFEKKGDHSFVRLKERLLLDVHKQLSELYQNHTKFPVEVALAALCIMISYENKSQQCNWFGYLSMAQKLIQETKNNDSSDFIWLKTNVLYHEVTGPSLLMLGDAFPKNSKEMYKIDIPSVSNLPESYMGICKTIYEIIGDVFLLSKRFLSSSGNGHLEQICEEGELLELRINQCQSLPPTDDIINSSTLIYHRIFFNLLKDAARLSLRQCVYMDAPVSIKTSIIVGRMIKTIRQLFGTVMDPALLFPFFTLAIDTVSFSVREWVIKSMHELYDRMGSGNILLAIELIEKVWSKNNEGKVHIFWPQKAKEYGLFVSLA